MEMNTLNKMATCVGGGVEKGMLISRSKDRLSREIYTNLVIFESFLWKPAYLA